MKPSKDFLSRVDSLLHHAEEKRTLYQDHMRQRMEENAQQADQFKMLAQRLMAAVINPRMEALVSRFDNAQLLAPVNNSGAICSCVFEHTPRFPASTRLSLCVSPGEQLEQVSIIYHLQILPVFIRFKNMDQVDLAVATFDEGLAAQWVEERLAEFVEVYLQLEIAKQYQSENMETDPVCGMPVNRNWAAGRAEHGNKTYYFCIDDCRRRFEAAPHQYAKELK